MKKNLILAVIFILLPEFIYSQTAFEEALKLAKRGNPKTMYNLALMYYDGHGVEQNKKKAAKWFKKSAKKGFAKSQLRLSKMYFYGDLLKPNDRKSFFWARKAAQNDDIVGIYLTAQFYYNGMGVKRDYYKAVSYYIQAANKGDDRAMYDLAVIYLVDTIIEQNPEKGVYWMQKAAEAGNRIAQYYMGEFYINGYIVERDVDKAYGWYKKSAGQDYPPAIFEAATILWNFGTTKVEKDSAEILLLKAVSLGNTDAMAFLGNEYLYGTVLNQDLPKAYSLLKKAVESENTSAMIDLAYMYEYGLYVVKDIEKVMSLLTKAANKGDARAQYDLSLMYYNQEDYEHAKFWAEKSAEQNIKEAMTMLAYIFVDQSDFEKAFYWYNKAIELNDAPATYDLAWWYQKGIYVEKDVDKAMYLYHKAAENNYYPAQAQLAFNYILGADVEQKLDSAAYWIERATSFDNQAIKKLFSQLFMPEYKPLHYNHYEILTDKQKQEILFSGITEQKNRKITEFYKTKDRDVHPSYDSINKQKDSSFVVLFKNRNGDLYLANISAWQKSQSFGKITGLSYEIQNRNSIKVEIRKFIWHYQNTYDDVAGIAYVEFALLHTKHPQFILKIFTDKYALLIYKGYLVN